MGAPEEFHDPQGNCPCGNYATVLWCSTNIARSNFGGHVRLETTGRRRRRTNGTRLTAKMGTTWNFPAQIPCTPHRQTKVRRNRSPLPVFSSRTPLQRSVRPPSPTSTLVRIVRTGTVGFSLAHPLPRHPSHRRPFRTGLILLTDKRQRLHHGDLEYFRESHRPVSSVVAVTARDWLIFIIIFCSSRAQASCAIVSSSFKRLVCWLSS